LKGTYEGEKGTVKYLLKMEESSLRVSNYVAYKEIQEIVTTENHNLFRGSQDPFTDNEKDVMTSYFTKTYPSLNI